MEADLGRRSKRRPGQSWRRHESRAEGRCDPCSTSEMDAGPQGASIECCFPPPKSSSVLEPELRAMPLSADALLLPGFDQAAGCTRSGWVTGMDVKCWGM